MGVVFVNYRAKDNPLGAASIHDMLARRFGGDRVFRDIVSMAAGDHYPTKLRQGLEQADVLVAVIGPRWNELTDEQGLLLIQRERDWVRWEIARAIERGIAIVPVLLRDTPDDATPPDRTILPESIRELANYQVFEFSQRRFGADLDRLADRLVELVPSLVSNQVAATSINTLIQPGVVQDGTHLYAADDRHLRAGRPAGRPIRDFTDALALEVHPAIEVESGGTGSARLPTYVSREHDMQLRNAVAEALAGRSSIAVLVGESSTGKTRACWEAVQTVPNDWCLWHPIDPGRPEATLESLPEVKPRTVLWLNELQHYLLTPDGRLGERVAAGLRELLRTASRGPVLVLGTIWPEYWAVLTSPPQRDTLDLHSQARALLTGHHVPVPTAFDSADLARARIAARDDLLLSQALVGANAGMITQFLAGVPALMERYETVESAARALIDAAIDARRTGHGPALPQPLLANAADGYLNDQQWAALDDQWLERAFRTCGAPCRGVPGPLTRIRPRPGQPVPRQPHYRLADYLEQHGRNRRQASTVPLSLWNASADYAAAGDLVGVADAARDRGLIRIAVKLCTAAAHHGDIRSVRMVWSLFTGVGRQEEAVGWLNEHCAATDAMLIEGGDVLDYFGRSHDAVALLQRAAKRGDVTAMDRLAELHYNGRIGLNEKESLKWGRRAAENGNLRALKRGTGQLWTRGRRDEALSWYRRAAKHGESGVLASGVWMLESIGHYDEGLAWLRSAADNNDVDAIVWTGKLLLLAGRTDEAVAWFAQRLPAEDSHADMRAARLLADAGRIDEAFSLYGRCAARLSPSGPFGLTEGAELLLRAGRAGDAFSWLRERTDGGQPEGLDIGVRLMTKMSGAADALAWLQRIAEDGNPAAMHKLARQLGHAGQPDQALDWYRRAAAAGVADAMLRLGELAAASGHEEEVLGWYQQAANGGNTFGLWRTVGILRETGRVDEALAWCHRAQDNPDKWWAQRAASTAAEILWHAGRHEEALAEYRHAARLGDDFAVPKATRAIAESGRIDEAIGWLQERAVEAGTKELIQLAADMLRDAGRVDEAVDWYGRAADIKDKSAFAAGDRSILYRVVRLLTGAGRSADAINWLSRRADAGNWGALTLAADIVQKSGDVEEALRLYQVGVRHTARAAIYAAEMLAQLGRTDEAVTWVRTHADRIAHKGYNVNDTHAISVVVGILRGAGRIDEATRLERYGWEPDGSVVTWPDST